jgi:hypothetical protein
VGISSSRGLPRSLLFTRGTHEEVFLPREGSRAHYRPRATHEAIFRPREDSRGHDSSPRRHMRRYSVLGRCPERTTVRPSDTQVGILSSGRFPSALLSAQVTRRHGFDAREPSREQDTWSRRHKTMSCVAPILRLVPGRSFVTTPTLQCGGLARTNPLFSVAREWTRGPTDF